MCESKAQGRGLGWRNVNMVSSEKATKIDKITKRGETIKRFSSEP